MNCEGDSIEDKPEAKSITETEQAVSKPTSVFKTDFIIKNNHNFRPPSAACEKGGAPRDKLEPFPEQEINQNKERDLKY